MKKIVGIISVLLVLSLLLFAGCTSSTNNNNTGTNTNTGGAQAQPQTKEYAIGETITLSDMEFKVNSFDGYEALGSEYINKVATDGALLYVVELTIKNNSNSEKTVTISNDLQIIDLQGRTYKVDSTAGMYAGQTGFEPLGIIENIPAGLSKTGVVVFEMPEGTTGKLKIKPSMFSGEAFVKIE
jgi:hypothetical protein